MNIDFVYILEAECPEIDIPAMRELWYEPFYKIGRSTDPVRRNERIGPYKFVEVVPFKADDIKVVELDCHRRWNSYRLHKDIGWYLVDRTGKTEWFYFPTARERLCFHHWITHDLVAYSQRTLGPTMSAALQRLVQEEQ